MTARLMPYRNLNDHAALVALLESPPLPNVLSVHAGEPPCPNCGQHRGVNLNCPICAKLATQKLNTQVKVKKIKK